MSRATQISIIAITLLAAVAIGVADVSDFLPELTAFVLIPVIAGTYYIGFRYGVFVALAAAVTELIAHIELATGVGHSEVIFNTATHTFIYILTAALIAGLIRQLRTITSLEEQRNTDLELAKAVHESVFAPVPDVYGTLSIGSRVAFARELGGDYYFLKGLDGKLFLCIADISGKSTAAALFAALLNQSVIEALQRTADLSVLVEKVNFSISPSLPEDMFVTMFCAFISDEDLSYVNAGHPPPLLYSKGEGSTKMLLSGDVLPLGVGPDLVIEAVTESFRPGDILLATTDGITESDAFKERSYEKLQALLNRNADADVSELTEAVFSQAVPAGTKNPHDDIIVVCIKRQPKS
ncbi:MAG: serine/threonine-protein phosphatase [Actinobacteria bacterium]|nr:serine/threonine-protein phosphatase [Actinomycetota bacterium]MCL5882494.1 serine/threonine-protein phosphatase [Actinomycetota bacterium]